MIDLGACVASLAEGEVPPSPAVREALRLALAEPVAQLQHDAALAANALRGPDPEHAISLLLDVCRDLRETLREIEGCLTNGSGAEAAAA